MTEMTKPGTFNDEGQMFHDEWGWVDPPFMESYATWLGDDGKYDCWVVYMGPWNVEIPYLDDLALREKYKDDDQAYYKDLHENWQRK